MDWTTCYSEESLAAERRSEGPRTHYQRDFDRLIFSSAFRRLQSKTQVFPLPGSKFVHNRLTHSLEVASVGRSLGGMVGDYIAKNCVTDPDCQHFYRFDLSNVIASACLAHDIGNPAFGHSGEKAISNYFLSNEDQLKSNFSEHQWKDLVTFEGNANALRLLTRRYKGKPQHGLGLTITTLAALLKYPCPSTRMDRQYKHLKKYGYFEADEAAFTSICQKLQMIPDGNNAYKRHPFVYLTEAADDICYSIMDMEDAHRLGMLSRDLVSEIFLKVIYQIDAKEYQRTSQTYQSIQNDNESIAYCRAKVINILVERCYQIFVDRIASIIDGTYNDSLISELEKDVPALSEIIKLSIKHIYRHHDVLEIEIAGYNLMSRLLEMYVPAVISDNRMPLEQSILRMLPDQYTGDINDNSMYRRVMNVLDHIASMTDVYAMEHYRKLTGIVI